MIKAWTSISWPNRISIMRLLLVPPFIIMLMKQSHWPAARYFALGMFIIMAISDAVDGILARRLNARTRLGAILDPLADKVLIICAVVLLSLPGSSPPGVNLSDWIVVFIVGKDLWVIAGFLVIYLVTDEFLIRPSRAGKSCTVGQLVMVGFVLLAPDINRLRPELGTNIAGVLSWIVAVLCCLAVISYTRMGLVFVAKEGKPLEEHVKKNG
jgi:cardiolipin synthase (CMP-forming)